VPSSGLPRSQNTPWDFFSAAPEHPLPEAKAGSAKEWAALAKEGGEQVLAEVLSATKQVDPLWTSELRRWPEALGFEVLTDNQTVAGWAAGRSFPGGEEAKLAVGCWWAAVDSLLQKGWQPRSPHTPPVSWVPRALTAAPDLLCNLCLDMGTSYYWQHPQASSVLMSGKANIRWIGDGAAREKEQTSSHATVLIAYFWGTRGVCLGLWGKFCCTWKPAWAQELSAVNLAASWTRALLGLDKDFDPPSSSLPDCLRGLVESALSPWLDG
jgi:hypothetical protein